MVSSAPVGVSSRELKRRSLHLIIVTGLSGAGRSTALQALEDQGFFCIDNLPPDFVDSLTNYLDEHSEYCEVGLGIDVRTGSLFEGAERLLKKLREKGHNVEVLFIDCADKLLVRRYSETRRPHPLAADGDVLEAIEKERSRLSALRAQASLVIDTTRMSVHELRARLRDMVHLRSRGLQMVVRMMSFGYKYGLPNDVDTVFDIRYLPNPHFVRELRPLTGCDPEVVEFVMRAPEAKELLDLLKNLLTTTLPLYQKEGKAYFSIGVGCTGGKHRSVVFTELLAKQFRDDFHVKTLHRDLGRQHA